MERPFVTPVRCFTQNKSYREHLGSKNHEKSPAVKRCCRNLLPNPHRIVAACRSLGERYSRHENRSGFADICGRYSRVSDGRLAERVLLQRNPYRLLQREGRGINGLLSMNRWRNPQCDCGRYDEFRGKLQLWAPVVWVVFIHSVFSSRIS